MRGKVLYEATGALSGPQRRVGVCSRLIPEVIGCPFLGLSVSYFKVDTYDVQNKVRRDDVSGLAPNELIAPRSRCLCTAGLPNPRRLLSPSYSWTFRRYRTSDSHTLKDQSEK